MRIEASLFKGLSEEFGLIWLGSVYGISTPLGYLKPNPVHVYINYTIVKQIF